MVCVLNAQLALLIALIYEYLCTLLQLLCIIVSFYYAALVLLVLESYQRSEKHSRLQHMHTMRSMQICRLHTS